LAAAITKSGSLARRSCGRRSSRKLLRLANQKATPTRLGITEDPQDFGNRFEWLIVLVRVQSVQRKIVDALVFDREDFAILLPSGWLRSNILVALSGELCDFRRAQEIATLEDFRFGI
jgi:hypothetical protein